MVIDVHTHITYRDLPELSYELGRKPFTVETLIKRMDMEGIDKSLILPLVNPENLDFYAVAGNNEAILAAKAHPDRLMACCNIDPRTMMSKDLGRLVKAFKNLGCVGFGELCASLPTDHKLYQRIYEISAAERMPMIFHFVNKANTGSYGAVDQVGLPRLEKMAAKFPDAIFIGHSPCFWNEIDADITDTSRLGYVKGRIERKGRLWKLMADYPNIYGDMSAGSGHNALSRDPEVCFEFINKFHGKILFGTDRFTAPDEPFAPQLPFLKESLKNGRISKDAYENMTHRNFERLFKSK